MWLEPAHEDVSKVTLKLRYFLSIIYKEIPVYFISDPIFSRYIYNHYKSKNFTFRIKLTLTMVGLRVSNMIILAYFIFLLDSLCLLIGVFTSTVKVYGTMTMIHQSVYFISNLLTFLQVNFSTFRNCFRCFFIDC